MPKLTRKLPSYRLHKPTGYAVVTLGGRDHYLGAHGSEASLVEYRRLISEWTAAGAAASSPTHQPCSTTSDLRICELLAAFLEHADHYYVKNGKPTGEGANIKDAVRPMHALYGMKRVVEFGPAALKTVREEMIKSKLSRRVINGRINRIRRVFKWGVENELVPASVLHALQAVAALRSGRSDARETAPVRPVSAEVVTATLPHVSSPVRAMIELQQLTGMRPNEVTAMRLMDIDRSRAAWIYRPASHKTEHHGLERAIYLGPKAQSVLSPFLQRPENAYLFSPKEAAEQTRERLRKPGGRRKRRAACPRRAAGDRYTRRSYYRAIARACEKAGIEVWGPNRLRHSAATFLRKQFGIEAARVVLGHRSSAVTEVYAELDRSKAADIMAQVG